MDMHACMQTFMHIFVHVVHLMMIGLLYKDNPPDRRHKHYNLPKLRPYPVRGLSSWGHSALSQLAFVNPATHNLTHLKWNVYL